MMISVRTLANSEKYEKSYIDSKISKLRDGMSSDDFNAEERKIFF